MIPSIGRIVHYRLAPEDIEHIMNQRGARGTGNLPDIEEGAIVPMIIVELQPGEGSAVNGQCFLDGHDTYWARNVFQGSRDGEWYEPPRV